MLQIRMFAICDVCKKQKEIKHKDSYKEVNVGVVYEKIIDDYTQTTINLKQPIVRERKLCLCDNCRKHWWKNNIYGTLDVYGEDYYYFKKEEEKQC